MFEIIIAILCIALVCALLSALLPFAIAGLIIVGIYLIYESIYFKGKKFNALRERIENHIKECNELNQHIEELKGTHLGTNQTDQGVASYHDASSWNFKREKLKNQEYAPNVYNCSRSVCDGARKKPFVYLCKYFGFKADENTLSEVENVLNNFEAVADGRASLQAEKETILSGIYTEIPFLIKKFRKKKLEKKLGFEPIDLSDAHYPKYIFKYISAGGNSSTECEIVMDIDNLNRFVTFLSEKIKFNKSVAGQRALMTSSLRQKIKERDGFTCKQCGASLEQEPHLLLEIDHIVPVSKGGLTTEDNLQTLCWHCNRSKGAKVTATAEAKNT